MNFIVNALIPSLIAALEGAALVIGFLGIGLMVGAQRAALAIILVRSSCDLVFAAAKSVLGGQTVWYGPGAAINALVVGLAVLFFLQSPVLIGSAVLPMWGGFLIAALASLIDSPVLTVSLRGVFWLVTYAAVFALPFGMIRSRESALRCLGAILFSSVVPVVYAFIELAFGPVLGTDRVADSIRLISTFTHPNIFAFYLVILLAVIFFSSTTTLTPISLRLKRILTLYVPVIIILLLLTGARSPWLAAAIVIIVYASIVDRRYLLCFVLVPFIAYVPGVEERLLDLESHNIAVGYERLNSYAWRQLLWQRTLDWLSADQSLLSFFFGRGFGSFDYYFVPLVSRGGDDTSTGIGMHNIYLQILFELGIFGLIGFLWIFVVLFKNLSKEYSRDKGGSIIMMSLALSYLIVGYSDNLLDTLVVDWYFWFTMGMVCAWYRLGGAPQ